jgi:hypothetical protein
LTKLSKEEDWLLEGEGETATHKEYEQRFGDLNKVFTSFKSRKSEYE